MVTYNQAEFIRHAIDSVLSQRTDFPFELVIGEDCSTDGTREIVADYESRYPDLVRVITSETNVGARENFYRVMKACRGKYVACCEGDDYWHDHLKLQKQADFLEARPEFGMVHSSYDLHEVGTEKVVRDYIKFRGFRVPPDPGITEIITECRISFRIQTCTVMLRHDLYERCVEADPYLHLSGRFLMGDTQLWAELAAVSKIGYIPESLATYRLLPESASRSKDRQRTFRFELSDCEMKLYLCDKYKLPASVRRNRELAWCEKALRQAFHEQNAQQALEVRKKMGSFTFKEWLFYLGARHKLAHSVLRVVAIGRDRYSQLNAEPSA
jgi:glycosyltransferase involved in cell wall biosynthesis